MNWYKKSQQNTFDFHNTKSTPAFNPNFGSLLDEVRSKEELVILLNRFKMDWEEINLAETSIIKVDMKPNIFIIDDFNYPTLHEANDWLYSIKIDDYIPPRDFSKEFWDGLGNNFVVYHATNRDNVESIQQNGINMRSESRGINNRNTGDAVFTSDNPDDISSYGDAIFEINLSNMKKDGYMPTVSEEEPLEEANRLDALARKIGLENFNSADGYSSEGLYPSTIIIFGAIPPKYLRLM